MSRSSSVGPWSGSPSASSLSDDSAPCSYGETYVVYDDDDDDDDVSFHDPGEPSYRAPLVEAELALSLQEFQAQEEAEDVTSEARKSSRRMLPRPFVRSVEWGLRMGFGVVFAALAAIAGRGTVAAPFLIPVFAVIITNNSVGASLASGVQGLLGSVIGCIVGLVVTSPATAVSSGLVRRFLQMTGLFVSVACLALFVENRMRRIIALVMVLVVVLPIVVAEDPPVLDVEPPLRTLMSVVIGLVVGVLMALPFPRSDATEMERMTRGAADTVGAITDCLLNAYLARPKAPFHADILLHRARVLFVALETQLARANKHRAFVRWEAGFWWGRGARRVKRFASLADAFHDLLVSLHCLETAVARAPAKTQYERAFGPYLRPPMMALVRELRVFLAAVGASWGWQVMPHLTWDARVISACDVIRGLAQGRSELFYSESGYDPELPSIHDMIGMHAVVLSLVNVVEGCRNLGVAYEQGPCDTGEAAAAVAASEEGGRRGLMAWVGGCVPRRPEKSQWVFAVRLAVGVVVASLVMVMPSLADTFGRGGLWAPLTVIFLLQGTVGGSLHRAFLRLEGTVAGAMFAYLALVILAGNQAGLIVALFVYVSGSGYVRASTTEYSYAGLVSAFTSALIAFGNEDPDVTVKEYALARITQTMVGTTVCLMVVVVRPGQWVGDQMETQLGLALKHTRELTSLVLGSFAGTRAANTCGLRQARQSMWRAIVKQQGLLELSRAEPQFWRPPVPYPGWRRVIAAERELGHALTWAQQLTSVEIDARTVNDAALSVAMVADGEQTIQELLVTLRTPLAFVQRTVERVLCKVQSDHAQGVLSFDGATAEMTAGLKGLSDVLTQGLNTLLMAHRVPPSRGVSPRDGDHHSPVVSPRAFLRWQLSTPVITRLSGIVFSMQCVCRKVQALWKALMDLESERTLRML